MSSDTGDYDGHAGSGTPKDGEDDATPTIATYTKSVKKADGSSMEIKFTGPPDIVTKFAEEYNAQDRDHEMTLKIMEERKSVRTKMADLVIQFMNMNGGMDFKDALDAAKDTMRASIDFNADKEANEIEMDARKADAKRDEEVKQAQFHRPN